MPKRAIDLDALARVVGAPPARYAARDPRNNRRLAWWGRAVKALGELLRRGDPPPRTYLHAMQERERMMQRGGVCQTKR